MVRGRLMKRAEQASHNNCPTAVAKVVRGASRATETTYPRMRALNASLALRERAAPNDHS
jgi:hypothetical protein